MVHTGHGLYSVSDEASSFVNLIQDADYEIPELGTVQSTTAFDNYYFVSLGTDIYYWDGNSAKARKLEGTYSPPQWSPNTNYTVGSIVCPPTYNGYIYECRQEGESGTQEPMWETDMSSQFSDGTARWVGIGSLELEGTGSKTVRAQCVDLYKGFLFLGNTEEDGNLYPYRVRWSQWQNPRLWHNNEDGSGMSGYVDVDDTEGRIIAIKALNDTLYIYKERSIIGMTYTGGEDTVFSKEVITTRAGLISPRAIVELPHMHIFVGQDDIYAFDGNTCIPIGDPVRDWFFQSVRPQDQNGIFGYYNEESGDVLFCFSSSVNEGNNNDKAIIYNTKYKTWSTREMYVTAIGQYYQTEDKVIDSVRVPYDQMNTIMIDSALYLKNKIITIVGDENGQLYMLDGYTDTRGDYDGYVVSKTHHMDSPNKIKRLLRIQFHIETQGDYNLYCQVGTSWNAETSQVKWTDKMYMNLEKPVPWYNHHVAPFVDVDLSARYFQIRFGTENNAEPFKILGYTLYYQLRSDE